MGGADSEKTSSLNPRLIIFGLGARELKGKHSGVIGEIRIGCKGSPFTFNRDSTQKDFTIEIATLLADLQEAVRLSNMRYKGGTTTFLEELDGQRALFSAELTLAQ